MVGRVAGWRAGWLAGLVEVGGGGVAAGANGGMRRGRLLRAVVA